MSIALEMYVIAKHIPASSWLNISFSRNINFLVCVLSETYATFNIINYEILRGKLRSSFIL